MDPNELIPFSEDFASSLIESNKNKSVFCSLPMDTAEQKKLAFNVMGNPEKKISDAVNLTIEVTDIYCETAQVMDQNTGELRDMPRIVLIDKDGHSYQSVSFGIYRAVCRLISIFGVPHWDEPIPITVKRVGAKDKQTYTLAIK